MSRSYREDQPPARGGRSAGYGPSREAYGYDERDPYGGQSRSAPRQPGRSGNGNGSGGGPGGPGGNGGGPPPFNVQRIAVLAGVLVLGIGVGVTISSNTQGDQGNIASSQQLDMAVADPEFCKQWGASAFVMDLQMYTTMNPSTSFVTQPKLQPGCVIGRAAETRGDHGRTDARVQTAHEHLCLHGFRQGQTRGALRLPIGHRR